MRWGLNKASKIISIRIYGGFDIWRIFTQKRGGEKNEDKGGGGEEFKRGI